MIVLYENIGNKNYWRCYVEKQNKWTFIPDIQNKIGSHDLAVQLLEVTVTILKPNSKVMCAIEDGGRYTK